MSLIKRALQKYPVPETLTSKPGERNLIELLSRFPNKGVGMKVYRKTWPENCYWHIYYNKLTSEKSGKVFGIKYWNDEMQDKKIAKIPGAMKRGIWQFDMNDTITLTPE